MSLRTLPLSLAGAGLALIGFAQSASAHIQLMDPPPRYELVGESTGIKSCPCGLGQSNRTCNLATDASDPDRSTRVLKAEAGSQITLRFVEFVDHSGTFRVAFDPEGADVADFNNNILVPMVPDPPNTTGKMWEIPVTLPNMTCDNCTLQLIQAMNGDMNTPVKDPTNVSSYYACVDLQLVPPGTMGTDPPDGDPSDDGDGMMMPGATPPANDGSMGTDGAASGSNMGGNLGTVPMMGDNRGSTTPGMTGSGTGVANNGTTTGVGSLMPGMNTGNGNTLQPSNGAPIMSGASESEESGGCSFSGRTSASPFAALAMAGMATALFARRRRQK
jgi:MYXO-CTERM domain-containing protein